MNRYFELKCVSIRSSLFMAVLTLSGCISLEETQPEKCPLVSIKNGEKKVIDEDQFKEYRLVKAGACKGFDGVLGQYKGVSLAAFYRCEDMCPENEAIYFTFQTDENTCEKIDGRKRPIYDLFRGSISGYICEPKWAE